MCANIVGFVAFQEKQKSNKGAKHTLWRFKWLILSKSILTKFPHTVFRLPVEAKPVILEKSSIYCSQVLLYYSNCTVVWNNVLGHWQKKVRRSIICNKSKYSIGIHDILLRTLPMVPTFKIHKKHFTLADTINRTCSMQWVPCIPQFCSWGSRTLPQFSQLWLLSAQSFTGKERLTCTHLCHMRWDR